MANLQIQSGAIVKPIYPYYIGNSDTSISAAIVDEINKYLPLLKLPQLGNAVRVITDANLGGAAPIPESKAQDMLAYLYNLYDICNPDTTYTNLKITLIGYSGGSQVAYNVAQDMRGKLFVDNLVTLGPTYNAYSGLGNIGHIWNLTGADDRYAGLAAKASPPYAGAGSTSCTLLGTVGHPYIHFGLIPNTNIDADDYFDFVNGTNGTNCGGITFEYSGGTSRALAIIEFLVNVVGVGKQK